MQYNYEERKLLAQGNEMVNRAKRLQKERTAKFEEQQRKAQAAYEAAKRADEEKKIIEQSKIDKEDFDDRVRLFLSKMSRELKTLDLKITGHASSYTWNKMDGSNIVLKDTKSTNKTNVVAVDGKGFEWN